MQDNLDLSAIEEMLGIKASEVFKDNKASENTTEPQDTVTQTSQNLPSDLASVFEQLSTRENPVEPKDNPLVTRGNIAVPKETKKPTAAQLKRAAKEAAKANEKSTIDRLSIIFDKVQKSKRADRYIVGNKNGKWGVVDSNGNAIIPFEYTRITSSNDRFFRVYGEFNINTVIGSIVFKDQAIFDYDGNRLTDFMPYTSNYSIGKMGLILGQEYGIMQGEENSSIWVMKYETGECVSLGKDIEIAALWSELPEFIMLFSSKLLEDKCDKAIRLDRSMDIVDVKDAIDELIHPNDFIKSKEFKPAYSNRFRACDINTYRVLSGKDYDNSESDIWVVRIANKYLLAKIEKDPESGEIAKILPYEYLDISKRSFKVVCR